MIHGADLIFDVISLYSRSWWVGEIVIAGQLWRGGGQRHQYPECPWITAAARQAVVARKTVQTLEVEEEEEWKVQADLCRWENAVNTHNIDIITLCSSPPLLPVVICFTHTPTEDKCLPVAPSNSSIDKWVEVLRCRAGGDVKAAAQIY